MQQESACDVLDSHDAGRPIRFTGVQGDLTLINEARKRNSHELRTCLAAITFLSGNLDLLYEGLDDGKRRSMIRDIRKHTQKLNRFVEDMLEMGNEEVPIST